MGKEYCMVNIKDLNSFIEMGSQHHIDFIFKHPHVFGLSFNLLNEFKNDPNKQYNDLYDYLYSKGWIFILHDYKSSIWLECDNISDNIISKIMREFPLYPNDVIIIEDMTSGRYEFTFQNFIDNNEDITKCKQRVENPQSDIPEQFAKIIHKLIKLSYGKYYYMGNCTEVVEEDLDEPTDMNITYDINDATQLQQMVDNSIQVPKERLLNNLCLDALKIITELTKDNKEENYSYWYSEDYGIYFFYDDEKDIHYFFGL